MAKPTKIEVLEQWSDDHLPCVEFNYNGRVLQLWWTDYKTIGALEYYDSRKAHEYIKPLLDIIDSLTDRAIKKDDDRTLTDFGTIQLPQRKGARA